MLFNRSACIVQNPLMVQVSAVYVAVLCLAPHLTEPRLCRKQLLQITHPHLVAVVEAKHGLTVEVA